MDTRAITFQLWDEIKEHARTCAAGNSPLPSDLECDGWLRDLLKNHACELPEPVFDFYAGELCALMAGYRGDDGA